MGVKKKRIGRKLQMKSHNCNGDFWQGEIRDGKIVLDNGCGFVIEAPVDIEFCPLCGFSVGGGVSQETRDAVEEANEHGHEGDYEKGYDQGYETGKDDRYETCTDDAWQEGYNAGQKSAYENVNPTGSK